MIDMTSIKMLKQFRETVALECKLAGGRDGQGALPEDFWPTYSAFANTHGGVVVLGVREKRGQFSVEGIANVAKVRKELFNNLNNRQKISANLLTDHHVREVEMENRKVLVIEIPRATRRQRPVHLTTNPLSGHTYRRLNDGDCSLPDEDVRRMLAEQVEESRDVQILPGFGLAEIDLESLHAYRNMLASHRLNHPWGTLDDIAFLRAIGAWKRDRHQQADGLTLAGILMFGQWAAIQETASYYFVDYQERPKDHSETRWLDRVVPDGTWSGNLFDFYRRVAKRLVADLKVPFVLKGDIRQDETLRHQALREALVNALVHADYHDRASVQIIKGPSGFIFRNPGLMRVPAEQALQGGESDCRNRTLHQMFLLIGLGERTGSGLPKIRQGWPGEIRLADSMDPYNQTRLELLWTQPARQSIRKKNDTSGSALKSSGKSTLKSSGKSTLKSSGKSTLKSSGESVLKSSGKSTLKSSGKSTLKSSGKTRDRILSWAVVNPGISIPELAEQFQITVRAVEKQIAKLQQEGRIRRVGPDKGGHWEVIP
jgi:predicted HTH transcriptional regulator